MSKSKLRDKKGGKKKLKFNTAHKRNDNPIMETIQEREIDDSVYIQTQS